MKNNILLITGIFGLVVGLVIGLHIGAEPVRAHNPVEIRAFPNPQATKSTTVKKTLYKGKVSYYSHAGCLGCSKGQIMGNGKAFNENAMTLAVPCEDIIAKRVKYNTKVLVTNVDNGKSVRAKITDCGGFSKYNRVGDLSKGLYKALEAKTDKSSIVIERI